MTDAALLTLERAAAKRELLAARVAWNASVQTEERNAAWERLNRAGYQAHKLGVFIP